MLYQYKQKKERKREKTARFKPLYQTLITLAMVYVMVSFAYAITWGTILSGDNAEVILNTANNTRFNNGINAAFNCSASVTLGLNLTNISLWTDYTGTFKLNQTIALGGTEDTIGVSSKNDTGISGWRGGLFTLNESSQVVSVKKWASTSALNVSIFDPWWENTSIADAVFIGDIATFSNPPTLISGTQYAIAVYYQDFTQTYNVNGTTLLDTRTTTNVNFTEGYLQGQGVFSIFFGIENMTTTGGGGDIFTINSTNQLFSNTPINRLINWNCKACATDNTCGFSVLNRTATLGIFINSESYNSSTTESTLENYLINISYIEQDWNTITGTFIYNNTEYIPTKTISGDNLIFDTSITTTSVNTQTNIDFYWSFNLINTTSTLIINSSTNSQTTNILNASICGYPHNVEYLNFTIYDEATLEIIPAKFDGSINWGTSSLTEVLGHSDTSELNTTYSFCFAPNDTNFIAEGFIELEKVGYISETYNLLPQTITNTSTLIPIYLINVTDSTSYIIYVRDSAYADVSEAIVQTERYYPSTESWTVVQSGKTNIDGKTIANLIEETINYRFKVYIDGALVHTSTPTKIFCESTPCTITLTLSGTTSDGFDIFEELPNLEHSLTYSSNVFTFTYSDTDTTAQGGRLKVIKYAFGGATPIICDETSTDTTAVITCDISSEVNGTYIATGYINRVGLTNRIVDRIAITKSSNIVSEIGVDGVLWGVFFIIGLVMLGIFKPAIAVVFGIAGFIMIAALGIASIPAVSLISVIIMALIIIWEFRQ